MPAAGNARCKYAARIDTDFRDEFVDHPRHESDVVDFELVRAVVADGVARVPVALVPIRIDDREASFVRKALEPRKAWFTSCRTRIFQPDFPNQIA
jgi:hypothetical protein